MFTGLVEGCGTVTSVAAASGQLRLGIRPHFVWEKPLQGESVAVNGACLSVEGWDGFSFRTYASAETLACTMLGSLSRGDEVNLERALSLGGRLGGHLVSGHVDTIAHVNSFPLLPFFLSRRVEPAGHHQGVGHLGGDQSYGKRMRPGVAGSQYYS